MLYVHWQADEPMGGEQYYSLLFSSSSTKALKPWESTSNRRGKRIAVDKVSVAVYNLAKANITQLSFVDREYSGEPDHIWRLSALGWRDIKPRLDAYASLGQMQLIEHKLEFDDLLEEFIHPELAGTRKAAREAEERRKRLESLYNEDFFYNSQITSEVMPLEAIEDKLEALLGSRDFTRKNYLRTAMLLHPDRNSGDGSKMSELNMLWQLRSKYVNA